MNSIAKNCQVEDCGSTYNIKKGMCNTHYQRYMRYGDVSIVKGITHRMSSAPEYRVWANMLTRCRNPKDMNYHHYGGRGITVCERWQSEYGFQNFYKDMGARPSSRYSIERIDNNGNYEPSNCKWATQKEQSNNKRDNVLITFNGVTKNRMQWAESTGIKYVTLCKRLERWSVERAITTK